MSDRFNSQPSRVRELYNMQHAFLSSLKIRDQDVYRLALRASAIRLTGPALGLRRVLGLTLQPLSVFPNLLQADQLELLRSEVVSLKPCSHPPRPRRLALVRTSTRSPADATLRSWNRIFYSFSRRFNPPLRKVARERGWRGGRASLPMSCCGRLDLSASRAARASFRS